MIYTFLDSREGMKAMSDYTIIIGDSVYNTSEKLLKNVLETASSTVQHGVYAAKKGNVVILLNKPNLSRERFRSLTKEYNRKGFVLLHNRGVSCG